MESLKQILKDEIPAFKADGEAFLNGEISKLGFKSKSGGFGVYAHRDGKSFMIRLRILSGVLSKEQLEIVAHLAKKYTVPMIHFTTRQAIQYHGISLEHICDIMAEGLEHNLYTRGAGGNYPRNVAMSPLSGVDPEEVFDVVPYAMAANAYFLKRINTYHLPRKLKVAFSSSVKDTAQATVQDLGFVATLKEGKPYFKVYLGGGLGRNPRVGALVPELLPAEDVLYALDAMVNLFQAEGDYENHNKARIRYIAERMGDEAFAACFLKHLEAARGKSDLAFKAEQPRYQKEGIEKALNHPAICAQKQPGLYSYYFHPLGGQLDVTLLEKINAVIAPMADVYGRLSMGEGMYLINLNGEEAQKVAEALDAFNYVKGMEKSRSCIGVPICQMGVLPSQSALLGLMKAFESQEALKEVLPPFYISGCPNSCGVHEIGAIGLVGKKKKLNGVLKGVYDVYMNGACQVGESRLGDLMGEVEETKVGDCFLALAQKIAASGETFANYVVKNPTVVQGLLEQYCY